MEIFNDALQCIAESSGKGLWPVTHLMHGPFLLALSLPRLYTFDLEQSHFVTSKIQAAFTLPQSFRD